MSIFKGKKGEENKALIKIIIVIILGALLGLLLGCTEIYPLKKDEEVRNVPKSPSLKGDSLFTQPIKPDEPRGK